MKDSHEAAQARRAEEWLEHLKRDSKSAAKGQLKIFLGMCAGVGKTFAMLKAAHGERALGRKVLIGVLETHGRAETLAEMGTLEVLPRRRVERSGVTLDEFDLDAAIQRRPDLMLIDELAHTNAPGSRHPKRYQDVLEVLHAGIDVYTTLNVQHLESRADSVTGITGITIRETVPDSILDEAAEVQLIDLSPEKLLDRLREGRVYLGERREAALKNFFTPEHLTALRELSLRVTADRVDRDLLHLRKGGGHEATWNASDRLMVAIGPNPQGATLIRAARRTASQLGAPWIVVYVRDGAHLSVDEEKFLDRNMTLARELGAEVMVRDDPDRVEGLIRTARERNVSRLILGKPEGSFAFSMRSRWLEQLFKKAGGLEISFIPTSSSLRRPIIARPGTWWTGPRRHFGYALLVSMGVTVLGLMVSSVLGYFGVGLVFLSSVLGAGLFLSPAAVVALSLLQGFLWNFLFIEPYYQPWIERPEDIALCVIFVVAAVTIGSATARLRLREERSRQGQQEALAQADLLALVRDSTDEAVLMRGACVLLERYFGVRSKVSVVAPGSGSLDLDPEGGDLRLGTTELAVASWCFQNGRESGRWTDTLRDTHVWCCPLMASGAAIGVWVIGAEGVSLGASVREEIRGLVSSLALGIERIRLGHAEQKGQVALESARNQQNLLNSVSHEMRTPLTSVIGLLELWSERVERAPGSLTSHEIQEGLELAREVDRIMEDLVSLSRLEAGSDALRSDWVDLEDGVRTALEKLLGRYSGYVVDFDWSQVDYVMVRADARVLGVVLRNVLENAFKHTPQGTRIRVTWREGLAGAASELWVEDSGSGIDEEFRERIFDRFFRGSTSTDLRGLGLGLSISRTFMEQLGGGIRVATSTLGGAAFVLEFPPELVKSALIPAAENQA